MDMASSERKSCDGKMSSDDRSLKLAVAISLLRSKILRKRTTAPDSALGPDALRWKRKAKERKQELLRLREQLREAEDSSQCDLFPQNAACKCHFFDNLGDLGPDHVLNCSDRFNNVLLRRFLRQLRFHERRRSDGKSKPQQHFSSDPEQLVSSIDFLVELCDPTSPVLGTRFANWSHQAVDFILATLRAFLSTWKNLEPLEGIISSLVVRLVRAMCFPPKADEQNQADMEGQAQDQAQIYVQHLLRKLGTESFIGQRTVLCLSERISAVADELLFLDPFDGAVLNMHESLFALIQLIEFLLSDYLVAWSRDSGFDDVLFKEWMVSIQRSRKALQLLENRNGLYALYMDRVAVALATKMRLVASLRKLDLKVIESSWLAIG